MNLQIITNNKKEVASMKTIRRYIAVAVLAIVATACQEELNPNSIFIDPVEPKSTDDSYTYDFDQWLKKNYTEPYNVEFLYKLDDNATDPNYNLVPTRLGMSDTLAHLALYLWYDVYDKVVNENFLRENGPRMIQLIGSSAINAANGTEKLGTAEGGIKVTLYKINQMETDNIDQLNEYVFKTMHHEFSHILHQKKKYPREFETLTPGDYDVDGWQYRSDTEAYQLGFASPYGSSQAREDFVEIIANYIVKSDAEWQKMLTIAGKDGKPGATIINQKLEICRSWLAEKWEIDIDALHKEVQARQEHLDYTKIMKGDFTY